MDHKYDVCIIIPTYNRSNKVVKAIKSCIEQTCVETIQIVVIDDGSTDDTLSVIKKIRLPKNRNLEYYKIPNSGVSNARNIGITKVRAKYLQFLDSDDYLIPNKLEKQIACLEEKDLDLVSCSSEHLYKDNEKQAFRTKFNIENWRESALYNSPWPVHSPLYNYEKLNNIIKFNVKLTCLEDWDLALKLALYNARIDYIPETLCYINEDGSLGENRLSNASVLTVLENAYFLYEGLFELIESLCAENKLTNEICHIILFKQFKYFRLIRNQDQDLYRCAVKLYRKYLTILIKNKVTIIRPYLFYGYFKIVDLLGAPRVQVIENNVIKFLRRLS